jgi:uncharacterized protein YegJ (DUF2314 family)
VKRGHPEYANMASKFDQPQSEPLFIAIRNDDPAMLRAYAQASATLDHFRGHLARRVDGFCCAKLKFRDPDESDRLGEDRFVYLWLTSVHYHVVEQVFSGTFFEVPEELRKWHEVGERLAFEAEDIFDWMVLENGHLHGGFTMRVAREGLEPSERPKYDKFVGVTVYEPPPN